ncbi:MULTISPECIES: MerR family transcriptional regulator [unclassified Pseudomonas]|nr:MULTISPECIES: MerR family transcriptional regulator [unclassified Pseudomonas]MEB0042599.1 MerR family transcriptional regulator [Pseudomonas sp. MH10]MEB0077266.1 MerR family transcriptional regulator [Pseudomonas sp. MH10out]MEB0091403.1 MerR family transcriptional regulator [Pseudomonas sp. CCI4.2]MEB0101613.1 MerR family transcriptional regulator [Pseudomonas sp. CCI3.2]MEB0129271.1 MerR family transcriptional regulator [Pseudomonas sp. CCI2.4]
MKIGEVAKLTGVSPDALRFYEDKGLIQSTRSANGYRCYTAEAVQLVDYIKLAQQLGFSLAEIGENLPELWSSTTASAELLAAIFVEKIQIIDQRIIQMQVLRAALAERAKQVCPLLRLP